MKSKALILLATALLLQACASTPTWAPAMDRSQVHHKLSISFDRAVDFSCQGFVLERKTTRMCKGEAKSTGSVICVRPGDVVTWDYKGEGFGKKFEIALKGGRKKNAELFAATPNSYCRNQGRRKIRCAIKDSVSEDTYKYDVAFVDCEEDPRFIINR